MLFTVNTIEHNVARANMYVGGPQTGVGPKALHVAAVLGNSELHSGRSGAVAVRGRSGQDTRVLLMQQGDFKIRRVGVIQSAHDDFGLGHQIQQGA